jgi:hypothetical protein
MLPTIYDASKQEILEIIQSGGKGLKPAGQAIQPVTEALLRLPDDQAATIVQTCDLLFSAVLSYEQAQFDIDAARDGITLVTARMKAGRALGVVEALFHGPTAQLLYIALDRAPIAYFELSEGSPALNIIKRTYDANGTK